MIQTFRALSRLWQMRRNHRRRWDRDPEGERRKWHREIWSPNLRWERDGTGKWVRFPPDKTYWLWLARDRRRRDRRGI